MFNDTPNTMPTTWFNQEMNYNDMTTNNVLGHLPDYISFGSMIKEDSFFGPYIYPTYQIPLNSPHDSSCSEGTPVSDYFPNSVTASYDDDDDLYIPSAKKTEKRGRRAKKSSRPEEKIFPCEYKECGKLFGRQEHVKRHIRSIHTKQKPYVCPYRRCQKDFSRSDNLNQHIRTHRKTSKDS